MHGASRHHESFPSLLCEHTSFLTWTPFDINQRLTDCVVAL